ncbi:MAG: Hpt domain-containing protein [Pseudomonadota bacterium]
MVQPKIDIPAGMDDPSEAAAVELLDRELIQELTGDYGVEILDELRESLAVEGRQGLARLTTAIEQGSAEDARDALHAVRGAGLSVGCAVFGLEAQRLEHAAKEGVVPSAQDAAAVGTLLERSLEALAAICAAGDS